LPNLLNISEDTTVFPWSQRAPRRGLRATIAVALALLIGQLAGHTSAGAIAAGAAFTVGFAVFHEALASVLLSMGLLTLGIASGTLAGSLGAQHTWVVLLLVLLAAVNYGLVSNLGPTASWMGQQCAVFVIVASYFPLGIKYAVGRTEMVLAGGALQMLVFACLYLVHQRTKVSAAPLSDRFLLRIRQLFANVRQEARPHGDTARYTLRLAITLLICTAIYRHFHVRNGYWSPMTAVLVLKPQWSNTLSRGIARLTGTVVGAAIAVLLARFVPIDHAWIVVLVIVSAWACFNLQAVNYAAFSIFITLYIVFLFRSGGFSQTSAAHIRLFNTILGGGIALLLDALWKFLPSRRQPEPAPNFVQ
jgi:hypothetical protein